MLCHNSRAPSLTLRWSSHCTTGGGGVARRNVWRNHYLVFYPPTCADRICSCSGSALRCVLEPRPSRAPHTSTSRTPPLQVFSSSALKCSLPAFSALQCIQSITALGCTRTISGTIDMRLRYNVLQVFEYNASLQRTKRAKHRLV